MVYNEVRIFYVSTESYLKRDKSVETINSKMHIKIFDINFKEMK